MKRHAMTRPSPLERAERAAKRFADKWWSERPYGPEAGRCFHDYGAGYLAGYKAAKREQSK